MGVTKQFSLGALKSNEFSWRTGLPAKLVAHEDCTTQGSPTVTNSQNFVPSDVAAMEWDGSKHTSQSRSYTITSRMHRLLYLYRG
jgi:hypothetical protein